MKIKQIIHLSESVSESTGDKPFDQMMTTIKRGTNKQKTADRKEQQKQTQQQARNAFGNMFGGGNPADKLKIKEQGVAEAEKKGLYYYVNKRKKAGTSRDADSPKAPTAQAWKDAAKTAKTEGVAEGWDKLTPQQKAHEYNLDAAQKEMDRRHAQGEDMTGAKIDKKTYKIVKPKKKDVSENKLPKPYKKWAS